MRIGILSNVNLDLLRNFLINDHELYFPQGYGQWIQETFAPNVALEAFNPDAVFIILDGLTLIDGVSSLSEAKVELQKSITLCKQLAGNYPSLKVFVSTLDIFPKSIQPLDSPRYEQVLMNDWDEMLFEGCNQFPNLHVFDLRNAIQAIGRDNMYSDKLWYLGSIPYSNKGLSHLSMQINYALHIASMSRKKVFVLDLDNTLWGGVLGDDGEEGIVLSESNKGAIYRDTQRRIKDLKDMGVLLAISSKNNYDDVVHVLDNHPMMVLRSSDFVSIKANWNAKSQNIRELSCELNLGLDSFVFLDDNPVEREEVSLTCPDVSVVDFPKDISKLPLLIQNVANEYFQTFRVTSEDLVKTKMYQEDGQRQAALLASHSLDDYLRSLDMKITLGKITDSQLERVSQLTLKTNQFNLRTARYHLEDIRNYLLHQCNSVYTAEVADRFGNNGLVFVLMLSTLEDGHTVQIDNLLMSCRVMGRRIEEAIMHAVICRLQEDGIHTILGEYIPTVKNVPVENLLDRLDFQYKETDESGVKYYSKDISKINYSGNIVGTVLWREA